MTPKYFYKSQLSYSSRFQRYPLLVYTRFQRYPLLVYTLKKMFVYFFFLMFANMLRLLTLEDWCGDLYIFSIVLHCLFHILCFGDYKQLTTADKSSCNPKNQFLISQPAPHFAQLDSRTWFQEKKFVYIFTLFTFWY